MSKDTSNKQRYRVAHRDEGLDWLSNLLTVLCSSLWGILVIIARGLWGLVCWSFKKEDQH